MDAIKIISLRIKKKSAVEKITGSLSDLANLLSAFLGDDNIRFPFKGKVCSSPTKSLSTYSMLSLN